MITAPRVNIYIYVYDSDLNHAAAEWVSCDCVLKRFKKNSTGGIVDMENSNQVLWIHGYSTNPPPGHVPPPYDQGSLNKALSNPYFWGGYVRGGVGWIAMMDTG